MNIYAPFVKLILSAALAFSSSYIVAKEYVVALSPYSSTADKKIQVSEVVKLVSHLKAKDSVWFIDGYTLETLGRVNIPDNPAYNSPKAKIAVNRQAISQLVQFAKTDTVVMAKTMPSGAIRLPQLLRSIANNKSSSNIEVMLFGSPHYTDKVDAAFSMTDGQFPSDGHILNQRTQTPYGLVGNKKLLFAMRLHWFYGSKDKFINDRHGAAVERFWTLYMERTGGKLVSFSSDLLTVLSRANNHAVAPTHSYRLNPDDDKMEMVRLPIDVMTKSIHQRPVSINALSPETLKYANNVEVGITWQCKDCDLDLYAMSYPNAPVLYFGKTDTPQGIYYKDYLYSPSGSNGFETIAFKVPLDLRVMKLVVNFYRGKVTSGAKGEIRLSIDGVTYSRTFHIKANKGNKGKGVQSLLNSRENKSQHSILFEPSFFTQSSH